MRLAGKVNDSDKRTNLLQHCFNYDCKKVILVWSIRSFVFISFHNFIKSKKWPVLKCTICGKVWQTKKQMFLRFLSVRDGPTLPTD
jgi:hypothetical protein